MVHLIKLCVGVESPAKLAQLQERRVRPPFHITRSFPKRAEELLASGSLYWVFKGFIRARQLIIEIKPVIGADGIKRCRLVFDRKIHLTRPRPRRAFQGWRYLDSDDAPPDLTTKDAALADMPDEMRQELARLGLI